MKNVLRSIACALLLGACSHLQESSIVGPEIRGTWSGEARFLDRALAKEYGTFPVEIEIRADNSVSGKVGDANLADARVKGRPEDYLVEGTLEGSVFTWGSLPSESKDRAVFLLAPPEGASTRGDVHLKSGRGFDLGMRACDVKLVRRD